MTRAARAALALLLLASAVHAQERGRDDRPRPPHDRVFKMVETHFVRHLKERLDLTDEQHARVLPHVQRQQADRRVLAQRRFRAMREMRRLLQSGTATEAAVEAALREVKAVEAEEASTLHRDREAIDAVLTPVQQAKYRLLEVEMDRRIRQALGRSRRSGREARPRRQD